MTVGIRISGLSEEESEKVANLLLEARSLSKEARTSLFNTISYSDNDKPIEPEDVTQFSAPDKSLPCLVSSWLLSNYEEAGGVSLPRQQIFDAYTTYCTYYQIHGLSQAEFGKVIRCVFPDLKTRRLGTRGNSKYHYCGIKQKASVSDSSSVGKATKKTGKGSAMGACDTSVKSEEELESLADLSSCATTSARGSVPDLDIEAVITKSSGERKFKQLRI